MPERADALSGGVMSHRALPPAGGNGTRRIFVTRLALGIVLALLVFGTVGALLFLDFLVKAGDEASDVHVVVLAPEGTRFDGVLRVERPTPLSALVAAGRAEGFDVELVERADGVHVTAVDGVRGRWSWSAERADGAPVPEGRADGVLLLPGDRLVWRGESAAP